MLRREREVGGEDRGEARGRLSFLCAVWCDGIKVWILCSLYLTFPTVAGRITTATLTTTKQRNITTAAPIAGITTLTEYAVTDMSLCIFFFRSFKKIPSWVDSFGACVIPFKQTTVISNNNNNALLVTDVMGAVLVGNKAGMTEPTFLSSISPLYLASGSPLWIFCQCQTYLTRLQNTHNDLFHNHKSMNFQPNFKCLFTKPGTRHLYFVSVLFLSLPPLIILWQCNRWQESSKDFRMCSAPSYQKTDFRCKHPSW